MKRHVVLTLFTATLLPFVSANAWETATPVGATAITSLPLFISIPGKYYLRDALVYGMVGGAAITVRVDNVTLDLNGVSLTGSALNNSATGVLVIAGKHNVTIQNGNIDGFGHAGIEFSENSAKNVVDNVHMDNNGIGVHTVSATSNIIKNCVIEGGAIGVLFSSGSGNRASYNTLGKQSKPALITEGHSANYFDNNLIEKGSASLGQLMTGATDRYRFETFVGFPPGPVLAGGINEFAGSL
jgi:hypothetical protein